MAKTAETTSQQDAPRPWKTAGEARDWQSAGRVRTPGGSLPRTTAVVELDDAQSEWVRREASAAGMSPPELLKRLIDSARAGVDRRGLSDTIHRRAHRA